jgi:indolepyruvate ferredoxin oxidoreductase
LMGYAFQLGLIPLTSTSIAKALELNAVEVEFNKRAFLWGRRAAYRLEEVKRIVEKDIQGFKPLTDLNEIIDWRANFLSGYHDAAYANTYRTFVEKVRQEEKTKTPESNFEFTEAVAKNLFKLMAYKDEYEVARLYTDGTFIKSIEKKFEGDYHLNFHLADPLLSSRDARTGELKKRRYPQFTLSIFSVLAKMKKLRGTRWDIFSYTQERKQEVQLIAEYRELIETLCRTLNSQRYSDAVDLAQPAKFVRGYGHVKQASIDAYKAELAQQLEHYYALPQKAKIIQAYELTCWTSG